MAYQNSNISNRYKMSTDRLNELKKELNYLETVREKEVAEQIKEARSFGDLSENSEYDEAKNAQAIMEARIAELEKMLQNSRVIDEESITTDHVAIGVRVEVLFVDDDETEIYDIVSSGEADAMHNKISDESPLGNALIGHRIGEVITAQTPGGSLEMKIMKIEKQSL